MTVTMSIPARRSVRAPSADRSESVTSRIGRPEVRSHHEVIAVGSVDLWVDEQGTRQRG